MQKRSITIDWSSIVVVMMVEVDLRSNTNNGLLLWLPLSAALLLFELLHSLFSLYSHVIVVSDAHNCLLFTLEPPTPHHHHGCGFALHVFVGFVCRLGFMDLF